MQRKRASKQMKWARRMVRKGRCRICAKPRVRFRWLCDYCQAKTNLYMKQWRARKRAPEANAPAS